MACKFYEELIDKYVEGLATAEEEEILEKHLKECPECSMETKQLKRIIKTASSLEQIDLPPQFTANLMSKIESIAVQQESRNKKSIFFEPIKYTFSILSSFFRRNMKAAAAVCGIFLVVLTVFTSYGLEDKYSPHLADTDTREQGQANKALPPVDGIAETYSMDAEVQEHDYVENQKIGVKSFSVQEMDQKIIKNADISIYVDNLDEKTSQVINIVERLGGYIESSRIEGFKFEDSARRAYYALRIPQSQLSKALDSFKAMGEVENEHISGENITEQYYDTEARLRNLENQEQRLLEILNMAQTVDEILRIESELNRVRTDIDILRGRLAAWDKMVKLSLINLNLIEQGTADEKVGMVTFKELFQKAKQGFISTVNLFINIFPFLAKFIGAVIPLAVLVIIILLTVRLIKIFLIKKG